MKRYRTVKNTRRRNKKLKQRRRKTHKGGMLALGRSLVRRAMGTAAGKGAAAEGAAAEGAAAEGAAAEGAAARVAAAEGAAARVAAAEGATARVVAAEGAAARAAAGAAARAVAGEGAAVSSFAPSAARAPVATRSVASTLGQTGSRLPISRAPLQARLPRAPPRPERRFTIEEAESIRTTTEIRALLEELQAGSSAEFPAGTRATTMRPRLMELLEARGRIYNPTAAERNAGRAALNQSIPRISPEFSTPGEATARTPISDEVGRFASEGGIEAGESARLFEQATGDAQALVDEVVPLNGRNLLTPIAEQGGQTVAQAARLLPEIPVGEQPTAAEIEAILDSIFPARGFARALEIGPQNLARQRVVQRGEMPQRNVNAYNEQIRDLVSVVLVHTPAAQVRKFTEVFTLPRLTRLKASLGAYFLRNPLDARLILDELFSILPRSRFNGQIIDNLITNLAAQPERALAELITASRALQGAALEEGQIQAMTFAKGMGWFAARAFYSLIAAGLGVVGLFAAAWANINSTEDLAREIRINREIFDARFPVAAEFRDRAALFFQGVAASIMDGIYDRTGIPRPAQRPAAAPAPPAVIQPSPEVWAWARYIGEYSRMLRDLVRVVTAQRGA